MDSYAILSADHDELLGETFGGGVADLSLPPRAGGEGKNHEIQRRGFIRKGERGGEFGGQ